MAVLALAAPTIAISDVQLSSGITLPATETALTGYTGVTFPNQPAGFTLLRVVVGSAGTGTVTVVGLRGAANKVTTVSNSTTYIFGPFDSTLYSDSAGLVHVNFSVVTGNSAGVYKVPVLGAPNTASSAPFLRPLHNPFESTEGAADW